MKSESCEGESECGRPLIKMLGSTNNTIRERALRRLLKTWLPSQDLVSDEEMMRVWLGLFYCFWHSDKAPVQSALARRLASLVPSLPLPLSLSYLQSFLLTMRRQWSGIDRLRLDKFYLLIRSFLHHLLLLLKSHSWDPDLTLRLMALLSRSTFLHQDDDPLPNANANANGNGVNYHVASVFLDELRPFLPLNPQTLHLLFNPFLSVMRVLPDKVLLSKLKSNMFDQLLKMGRSLLDLKVSGGDVDSSDDVVVLGTIAIAMGFSGKFYDLGSSPDCCQGNRKVLFALHEDFSKLEKEAAAAGVEVLLPQVNVDGEDDEVPELVPIVAVDGSEDAAEEPASNGLKKCKKAKKASDGSGKKSKKKKKEDAFEESKDVAEMESDENSKEEQTVVESLVFNESVISNLQMQFEKVAADVGLENGIASVCEVVSNGAPSKKRKRAKRADKQQLERQDLTVEGDAEGGTAAKSEDKSAKKVRFSMKSNLVWKPHSPLPPQSLRIPPSVTPRGSALKKGVSPGPIRDMPLEAKKAKRRANSVKGRKKLISTGVKRPKKLKSLSG